MGIETDKLIQFARDALSPYGRDYAIGAVRGLAVRNMMSVELPESTEGFYPIVKIHEMALRDLEEVFYSYIQDDGSGEDREKLIMKLIDKMVWE